MSKIAKQQYKLTMIRVPIGWKDKIKELMDEMGETSFSVLIRKLLQEKFNEKKVGKNN